MTNRQWLATVAVLGLTACAPKNPQGAADPKPGSAKGPTVTWTADVQPLVQAHCADCHVSAAAGGLSLESYSGFATTDSSACYGLTVPQAVAAKVSGDSACTGSQMPVGGEPLSADEQQKIRDWADAGAPE